MNDKTLNNFKLGIFVLAGLLFLIVLLYMIGKNRNMFGFNYVIKARFENVQGLKTGNNVRFAGIDIGTVSNISMINDTIMEVEMSIDNEVKNIIRKNAIASIGTDGLVGNKVVNIISLKKSAPLAENNDILNTKKPVDTDEMLRTFYKTNNDISIIAQQLKITMTKINDSNKLWEVINNKDFANNLKSSANQIKNASTHFNELTTQANNIVKEVNEGKGTLGLIIKDTTFSKSISNNMKSINNLALKANELSVQLKEIMEEINHDIKNGDGIANKILKDSQIVIKINNSLNNIENGTNGFNQNMEALKHNFLFRGYFKKLEKQNAKKQ